MAERTATCVVNDQLSLVKDWDLVELLPPLQDNGGVGGGSDLTAVDAQNLQAGDGGTNTNLGVISIKMGFILKPTHIS